MSPLPRKKKNEPEDNTNLHEELEIRVELATYSREEQSIIDWRQHALIGAGVNSTTATLLAHSLSADLHEALNLKAKGCTDALLLEIMR